LIEIRKVWIEVIGLQITNRCRLALPQAATKQAIATRIAQHFPELAWNLPQTRKAWMNESYSMTIFDAVSLGLTYLSRFEKIFPNDREQPPTQSPG